MSQPDWAQLTDALVIPYQAHREAGLHIARGGPARRKPARGYPATLSLPEMILATILRARFRMPVRVAAELFGVVTGTIAKAERQIRPLLDQRLDVIQPAGTHVKTLADLTAFAAAHGVTLIPGTKASLLAAGSASPAGRSALPAPGCPASHPPASPAREPGPGPVNDNDGALLSLEQQRWSIAAVMTRACGVTRRRGHGAAVGRDGHRDRRGEAGAPSGTANLRVIFRRLPNPS